MIKKIYPFKVLHCICFLWNTSFCQCHIAFYLVYVKFCSAQMGHNFLTIKKHSAELVVQFLHWVQLVIWFCKNIQVPHLVVDQLNSATYNYLKKSTKDLREWLIVKWKGIPESWIKYCWYSVCDKKMIASWTKLWWGRQLSHIASCSTSVTMGDQEFQSQCSLY